MIDIAFMELATSRLAQLRRGLRRSAEDLAYDMMRTKFRHLKEEFGTEHSNSLPFHRIQVPGFPDDFNAPEAGIERGKMIFSP